MRGGLNSKLEVLHALSAKARVFPPRLRFFSLRRQIQTVNAGKVRPAGKPPNQASGRLTVVSIRLRRRMESDLFPERLKVYRPLRTA